MCNNYSYGKSWLESIKQVLHPKERRSSKILNLSKRRFSSNNDVDLATAVNENFHIESGDYDDLDETEEHKSREKLSKSKL